MSDASRRLRPLGGTALRDDVAGFTFCDTYGLMHLHDDEDERTTDIEGIGAISNLNAFKVWCNNW